jgi:biotin---protein ligase
LHSHRNAEVKIVEQTGIENTAKVLGIDKLGYLLVRTSYGKIESVLPDGNSFDMLRGLIVPKTH